MSTIIKASGTSRPSGAVPFVFEDMTAKADRYLEQVRREAAAIIAEAREEAARISRQAEEAGRLSALQAAERTIDEKIGRQMATLLPALSQAIDRIDETRQGWLAHWEQAAIGVAARIAARIVRRELAHDPRITLTWVREALELASGSQELQL